MNPRILLILAAAVTIVVVSGCVTTTEEEKTKLSANQEVELPETAFLLWCEAFVKDDFQTAYDMLSMTAKKGQLEQHNIKNAADYENHVKKAIPKYKEIFQAATIDVHFFVSNSARGIAQLGDNKTHEVHFVREDGEWKIEFIK